MTNGDRFFEAFAHMEHCVMGRRLAKFTLRHRFWLEAMDSPVVKGGEVSLLDLEMAARVCAIPFGELDRLLPRLVAGGARWWEMPGWLWRGLTRSTEHEIRLFHGYLMDHGCPPKTWDTAAVKTEGTGEAPDNSPLPELLSLVTGLMGAAKWDPDTVWALSPGEAEWYLAGIFTHRGVDVGLKTDADEAMEKFLAGREKARK